MYYFTGVLINLICDFDTLKYHLEYKWTPGFNDDVVQDNVEEEVDWNKVISKETIDELTEKYELEKLHMLNTESDDKLINMIIKDLKGLREI